jgi:hypothetical protein
MYDCSSIISSDKKQTLKLKSFNYRLLRSFYCVLEQTVSLSNSLRGVNKFTRAGRFSIANTKVSHGIHNLKTVQFVVL